MTPNLATRLGQELPEYSRLKDAFCQAGVVKPTNLSEIQGYLKRAASSNPARGEDIYYLAFDNNVIRNRLYSTIISIWSLPRAREYAWTAYGVARAFRTGAANRSRFLWSLRTLQFWGG